MPDMPAIDQRIDGALPAGQESPRNLEQMKALAAQFEAVLLGQMMRQMRDAMFDENDDDAKATGFSGGPLIDQIYSDLSMALSRAGGIGLSDALSGALVRQSELMGGGGLPATLPQMLTPLPSSAEGAAALVAPNGRVSSSYGWRQDPIDGDTRFHAGTDIAMPAGQDVVAAGSGVVEAVGELPGYGLTVTLRHPGGMATRYAHLSEADVKAGDAVAQGQVIAKSGSSGRSTGPHLHFEVIQGGRPIDPAGLTPWRD
jgi:murein DD-endopeptidase MepM/ murein hydrolase activator NlpD